MSFFEQTLTSPIHFRTANQTINRLTLGTTKQRTLNMLGLFITTLVTALSLLVVDLVVPGVAIASFPVALAAALSIGIVNASIKPILRVLSLPVTVVTLGAFSLIVNGFCFWLATLFVPGFAVHGVFSFIVAPIVLSMVSTFLTGYFISKGVDKKLASVAEKLNLKQSETVSVQSAGEPSQLEATELS